MESPCECGIEPPSSISHGVSEKRPLGRPRHRWEDNIRMDPKEIGINTRSMFDLAQGRDYWRVLINDSSISHAVI